MAWRKKKELFWGKWMRRIGEDKEKIVFGDRGKLSGEYRGKTSLGLQVGVSEEKDGVSQKIIE